jgi:hypothetical protein
MALLKLEAIEAPLAQLSMTAVDIKHGVDTLVSSERSATLRPVDFLSIFCISSG